MAADLPEWSRSHGAKWLGGHTRSCCRKRAADRGQSFQQVAAQIGPNMKSQVV